MSSPRARPRVTVGMIVLNGAPFVDYAVRQVYPWADEIIVVEGASQFAKHAATPDAHSLDDTLARLAAIDDPEKKIRVVTREGFWPEKTEQTNGYTALATGELIFMVDSDEFYHPEQARTLIDYMGAHPEKRVAAVRAETFVCGFDFAAHGGRYEDPMPRVYRFEPGYSFVDHRPPTIIEPDGQGGGRSQYAKGYLTLAETRAMGVQMFHYSYTLPLQVEQKLGYYGALGWQSQWNSEFARWYRDNWLNFKDPFHMHPDTRTHAWLQPFAGEHPSEIRRLRAGSANERINGTAIVQRHTDDIWAVLMHPAYPRAVEDIAVRSVVEKTLAPVRHLGGRARLAALTSVIADRSLTGAGRIQAARSLWREVVAPVLNRR
jgi:hypothetical protein